MEKVECKFCVDKSCAVEKLNDSQYKLINDNSKPIIFKSGDLLYKQGTVTDEIIYIKTGIVKEYITAEDGSENIVRIVKAPSYLGILSNVKNSEHFYSVSALTNAKACLINKNSFNLLIEENGKFGKEILDSLRQNEFYAYHINVSLKHKHVTGRVADTLLFLSNDIYESDVFDLCLNRAELASLIGASRENITRVLFNFQEENILKINKRHFEIRDKRRLEMLKING